ncbi:MAG: aminotransferase class I/II-fold pyridoxal phosphate-dependent enzyme, partial [Candidatus Faecivicinus sp.]|nr:aminotransferase class I/II-fold pyridoxal phosphate-dependent enzyme [Candidatus Faecivicinus sp.]
IVNTPCNPTGAAYDMDTLQMLARVAQEYDLLILADEIYTRYLYDGEFIPMRTLPGMAERTVTLNSFSKNFLMTGWRVGYIIAHPELIQVFKAVNDALTYAAPSISQRAAIKALSIRDEIAQTYITKYRDRVFYASDCIEKIPYLSLLRPRGTFYLFPGIAKTGMDDRAFCAFLLEKAHLLVSPGSAFGSAGAGHFRIACTVSQDKLAEAMRRLAALSAEFE